MFKILLWIAVGAAGLTMGCEPATEVPEGMVPVGEIEDGSYFGTYSHYDAEGLVPAMELTVEGGQITAVRFSILDTELEPLQGGTEPAEGYVAGSGTSYSEHLDALREELLEHEAYYEYPADAPTELGRQFHELAAEIVGQARDGDTSFAIITMSAHYVAEDEPDEDDWVGHVEIAFEGPTIVDVHYDEVRYRDGEVVASKRDNGEDVQAWVEATGVDPSEAFDRMAAQLRKEALPAGVDTISGATRSSRRFVALAREALSKRVPVEFGELRQAL